MKGLNGKTPTLSMGFPFGGAGAGFPFARDESACILTRVVLLEETNLASC